MIWHRFFFLSSELKLPPNQRQKSYDIKVYGLRSSLFYALSGLQVKLYDFEK